MNPHHRRNRHLMLRIITLLLADAGAEITDDGLANVNGPDKAYDVSWTGPTRLSTVTTLALRTAPPPRTDTQYLLLYDDHAERPFLTIDLTPTGDRLEVAPFLEAADHAHIIDEIKAMLRR